VSAGVPIPYNEDGTSYALPSFQTQFFLTFVSHFGFMKCQNMNAEIISIGDELLIGQTINTNAAWMGQELNKIGIDVAQVTVISDEKSAIISSLDAALDRSLLVIITGGLGPTKDDITKNTLAEYFGTPLREDTEILQGIEERLRSRHLELNSLNRRQALVPSDAKIFPNRWGTAPGMWFESHGKRIISLPGVPTEMKGLMTHYILPELKSTFELGHVMHRTILTTGEIEAHLAEKLKTFEEQLPGEIKLAYLPSYPVIKLRLSARGDDKEHLEKLLEDQTEILYQTIPELIFGQEQDSLEDVIGKLLAGQGKTLATAESCTGGAIASTIVSVPGSSRYFLGSVVAYSNEIKIKTLNVKPDTIENEGAVSEGVVRQMVQGIRQLFNSDYAIAVTGIAGPDGGTKDKPVGTTWIGIAAPDGVTTHKYTFGNDRYRNIHGATMTGLNLLRKHIQRTQTGNA
jgi:nicotinamide-nucleotide amidase